MPTEDTSEHDIIHNPNVAKEVLLKEFLLGIINERERKYDQRFASLDKAVYDGAMAVKEALQSANATTKDALASAYAATKDALAAANGNIATASASVDKRFESVNEFRAQLADQQETFARKADVDGMMGAFEKAFLKTESSIEKRFEAFNTSIERRFDSVNAFREQMADMQETLARKEEVTIRIDALDKKLDAAVMQLQANKAHSQGFNAAWGVIIVIVNLVLAGVGVFLSTVLRK